MYFDIDAHRDCFKTNEDQAYFWSGLGENGQDVAVKTAIEVGAIIKDLQSLGDMAIDKWKEK